MKKTPPIGAWLGSRNQFLHAQVDVEKFCHSTPLTENNNTIDDGPFHFRRISCLRSVSTYRLYIINGCGLARVTHFCMRNCGFRKISLRHAVN